MFEYYQIYWIKIHYFHFTLIRFTNQNRTELELAMMELPRDYTFAWNEVFGSSAMTSNRWRVETSSWKQFEIPPQKTEKSCKQIVYLRSRKYTKLKTSYSSPSFSCKAKRIVFQRGNEIQEKVDVFVRVCMSTRIARETLANITIFQIPWEKQSNDFMEIGISDDCLVIVQFQMLEIRRYVNESSTWH